VPEVVAVGAAVAVPVAAVPARPLADARGLRALLGDAEPGAEDGAPSPQVRQDAESSMSPAEWLEFWRRALEKPLSGVDPNHIIAPDWGDELDVAFVESIYYVLLNYSPEYLIKDTWLKGERVVVVLSFVMLSAAYVGKRAQKVPAVREMMARQQAAMAAAVGAPAAGTAPGPGV
jgi:hypothetical protein